MRDGWSLRNKARGGRLPQWAYEEPASSPAEDAVIDAFFALSSTRAMGMVLGPIPWTAIAAYADRIGLARETSLGFIAAVQHLDDVYLNQLPTSGKAGATQNG